MEEILKLLPDYCKQHYPEAYEQYLNGENDLKNVLFSYRIGEKQVMTTYNMLVQGLVV